MGALVRAVAARVFAACHAARSRAAAAHCAAKPGELDVHPATLSVAGDFDHFARQLGLEIRWR
jgi:hypothetical protein